jgi:hypothetical protein
MGQRVNVFAMVHSQLTQLFPLCFPDFLPYISSYFPHEMGVSWAKQQQKAWRSILNEVQNSSHPVSREPLDSYLSSS